MLINRDPIPVKAHMQIERELGKNVKMQKLPDNQGAIMTTGLPQSSYRHLFAKNLRFAR